MTPEERATVVVDELLGNRAEPMQSIIQRHIKEAVAEALACPVPSPVSSERIQEIFKIDETALWLRGGDDPGDDIVVEEEVQDLISHIKHLEALLRDVVQDPSHAVTTDNWNRMYRLGQEKMKEKILYLLKSALEVSAYSANKVLNDMITRFITLVEGEKANV